MCSVGKNTISYNVSRAFIDEFVIMCNNTLYVTMVLYGG